MEASVRIKSILGQYMISTTNKLTESITTATAAYIESKTMNNESFDINDRTNSHFYDSHVYIDKQTLMIPI